MGKGVFLLMFQYAEYYNYMHLKIFQILFLLTYVANSVSSICILISIILLSNSADDTDDFIFIFPWKIEVDMLKITIIPIFSGLT